MKPIGRNSFKPIHRDIPGAFFYSDEERVTSNLYLFEHDGKKLIVDSGDGKDPLGFHPDVCFLTHGHYDHTGGVKESWKEVYIHPLEDFALPYMNKPKNAASPPLTSFEFGSFQFEIIHTPGHTPGSMCLFDPKLSMLVSGDTLFAGGVQGRTDIGHDDAQERMDESLFTLSNLDWKILCPGHGELEFK
jgi:hydroxyacylglutathione hydrolase